MAVRLECAVKNYHWGKVGGDSKVAQLAKANHEEFTIEEAQTYAELWMGTLHTGPSLVKPGGELLSDYIKKNTLCLGETILSQFDEQLPFLFKVLSVNLSLSIQAHPNKRHAEELNKKFPDIYRDSNHKPEMALALTDFEGMCGFRPYSEILSFVSGVSELSTVLGESAVEVMTSLESSDLAAVRSAMKSAFSSLMRCDSQTVSSEITKLITRLESATEDSCVDAEMKELVTRLNTQFPGDVGVFAAFFLNHMKLKPGEAMFLAANLPHAYLSGDCIECMATSDNVVRAGLTPKYKDVDTLVDMLDYTPRTKAENIMSYTTREDDSSIRIFSPPVPDFSVHHIQLTSTDSYTISEEKSASILLITEGGGDISNIGQVKPGHVLFIPSNEKCSVIPSSNSMRHAEELNKKFPDIYRDSNHKPEMALALTDFEGMCGFRPYSEILSFVSGVVELSTVLGESAVEVMTSVDSSDLAAVRSAMKSAFSSLMRCDSQTVSSEITKLITRLESAAEDDCVDAEMKELVTRLNTQFPGDVGVFAAFFLNHMKLKPGEAMFLAANLPHAYLSGDCMECMATSDNVVRAGLTPKYKDVDTLVDMLDYTPRTKAENIMSYTTREDDSSIRIFSPPVPDFSVHHIQLTSTDNYTISEETSASILLITEGGGDMSNIGQVKPGHVLFIPSNEKCSVIPSSNSMVMYRALCGSS